MGKHHRQKAKGKKRPRSWHRRGPGPGRAFARRMKTWPTGTLGTQERT